MAYEFDLFLSYSRKPSVHGWVKNHFYPVLRECLEGLMPRDPEIFVDWQLETGVKWPTELARTLHRSRYLIAVWSPQYFRSPWCVAEWQTVRRREELSGRTGDEAPRGLVLPVVFSDGDSFPEDARSVQHRDLSRWGYPYEVFKNSPAYLDFHDAVRDLAEEVVPQLERAPPWQSDWPILRPPAASEPSAELPRMR